MFKKAVQKISSFVKKQKALVATLVSTGFLALSKASHATGPATGNTDLDTLVTSMETGLSTIKTGGLYLIGAIITIAVIFLGGRWLWNLFRSWLSRAA